MWLDVFSLVLSLVIILISCELFTNGIEWLGRRLRFGDGVVGSIFSAVGTCLPETTIPIIAIFFSKGRQQSINIGIGAIVGAPFMLSTLAFFLTGVSVITFWRKRRTGLTMKVNCNILSRDISFFILTYGLGIFCGIVDIGMIKYLIAVFLILLYVYYIVLTVKNDNESNIKLETLHIVKVLNTRPRLRNILLQITIALGGIALGAELFIHNVERISGLFGISALVLSLIITPVATELPEKFNSVIWISKKRDTLALGNITGAMVFQSCIPISIGIVFTPWQLDERIAISSILAVLSALVLFLWIELKGKLSAVPLLAGGFLYLIFIMFISKGSI